MKFNITNIYLLLISFVIYSYSTMKIKLTDKIDIKIFYDVLCGDSVRVFKSSIEPYYKNTEFQSRINLVLIPGAKMTFETSDGSDVYFSCQHGEDECLGNTFHACAFYKLEPSLAYKYIICYMSNIREYMGNNFDVTQYCSSQLNFDYQPIATCAQSDEGKQYMLTLLKRKSVLKDNVYFSPWAVVNGEHDDRIESMIFDNLTDYSCKALKYDKTIKICASYQEFYGPVGGTDTNKRVEKVRFKRTNGAIEVKEKKDSNKDSNKESNKDSNKDSNKLKEKSTNKGIDNVLNNEKEKSKVNINNKKDNIKVESK